MGVGAGVLLGTQLTAASRTITGQDVTEQAAGGALWAIDADTGQELWRREVPVTDDERPLMATAAGEQVLVVDGDGTLRSHDRRDGTLRWERPPGDTAPVLDAALIDGMLVVVTGELGVPGEAELSVQALDPDTGDRRRSAGPVPAVVLTSVGPVLFEPSDTMVGLDPHDGSARWQEPHDHEAPYGVGHGPLATVVTQDEQVTVVDARDGQTRFRRSASASGSAGGLPAGDARDDGISLDAPPGFEGPERILGIFGGYLLGDETADEDVGNELTLVIRDLLTGQVVARTSGEIPSLLADGDRLLIETGGRIHALRSPTTGSTGPDHVQPWPTAPSNRAEPPPHLRHRLEQDNTTVATTPTSPQRRQPEGPRARTTYDRGPSPQGPGCRDGPFDRRDGPVS